MAEIDIREIELMKRIKAGEAAAFRELFDAHYSRIYQCCYRFVRQREAAEDICQDVFVQVYRKASTFHHRSQLSTWIYRIAVNLSLNYLKRHKRRIHDETPISQMEGDPAAHADCCPEALTQKEDLRRHIRQAVDALPEKQRTVIILQKFQGLTSRQIADILDETVGSVEARLHRAKRNLSKKLSYLKNVG